MPSTHFHDRTTMLMLNSLEVKYSQQLPVEDTNNSRALQAIGGSAALALLEGVWQPLDIKPCAKILWRT